MGAIDAIGDRGDDKVHSDGEFKQEVLAVKRLKVKINENIGCYDNSGHNGGLDGKRRLRIANSKVV